MFFGIVGFTDGRRLGLVGRLGRTVERGFTMANAFGIPDPICDNCGDPIKPATLDDVINGTASDYGRRDVQYGKKMVHANRACASRKPWIRHLAVHDTYASLTEKNVPFTEVSRFTREHIVPKTMGFPSKLDNARAQYGGR